MTTKKLKSIKVALVHDYLREYGGAERVVEALHEIFPDAPLYVSFIDSTVTGIHWQKFSDWIIYESWLTKIPFYKKLFSPLRIFAPQYFSKFDMSEYDLVISSTNAYFSKAVKVPNGIHISYCHTPSRSLYGYTTMTNWKKNVFTRFAGTIINHILRIQDVKIARTNVDYFIANSQETASRIKKFYRLDSTVIYPPIEIEQGRKFSTKNNKHDDYYLYVGRIAQSKHVDLVIRLANKLGFNLKVVGSGKGLEYLQSIAHDNVTFYGAVSDDKLHSLYEGAKALLFPAEDEDFGMVPIEAMGHGVPVIAHNSGGPKETIHDGMNGYLFNDLTVASMTAAIKKLEKTKFNKQKIYQYSQQFSKARFKKEIEQFVLDRV